MTREQLETLLLTSPTRMGRISQMQLLAGIEDYLHVGGDQLSASAAAKRLGVTPRTVTRWRKKLRDLAGAS